MYIKRLLLLFLFIPYQASSENNTKKIIIFVPSEYDYPLISSIFPSKKKKDIAKRWKRVHNLNAEQKGLQNITSLEKNMFLQSNYVIYTIKEKYKTDNTDFFLYNWDGSTKSKDMYQASLRLAKEVAEVTKKYQNKELILIGFSHGGNIICQSNVLAPIQKNNIHYDKVILLGTPIGKKTERWVAKKKPRGDYTIKNIYVASSHGDYIQIKDFLFNFPFCNKFLIKRTTRVHNFYVYFKHLDKFKTNIFFYHPNHRNFWHYSELQLKGQCFKIYPIIYYILDIINKDYIIELFNQSKQKTSQIGIVI